MSGRTVPHLLTVLWLAPLPALDAADLPHPPRPNIVFVLADDKY
jgi:hypothetical protein